jgi:hypothetical protein
MRAGTYSNGARPTTNPAVMTSGWIWIGVTFLSSFGWNSKLQSNLVIVINKVRFATWEPDRFFFRTQK